MKGLEVTRTVTRLPYVDGASVGVSEGSSVSYDARRHDAGQAQRCTKRKNEMEGLWYIWRHKQQGIRTVLHVMSC